MWILRRKLALAVKRRFARTNPLFGYLKYLYNLSGKMERCSIELKRTLRVSEGVLPNFLIAGAQKGGTTSLYYYLMQHPWMVKPLRKEVHYFDINYDKPLNWYRSFFPSKERMDRRAERKGGAITGEATPNYLLFPKCPARMHNDLPGNIKIIFLLRNPIDRAYSHYQMAKREGMESAASFEEAIAKEHERLSKHNGCREIGQKGFEMYASDYAWFSYLEGGKYSAQTRRYLDLFPKDQLLFIKSEDMYRNPNDTLGRICDFLKIPRIQLKSEENIFQGFYSKDMDDDLRSRLNEYFKPHNQGLYEMVGTDYGWQ